MGSEISDGVRLFSLVGLLPVLAGVAMVVASLRRAAAERRVVAAGRRVQATVVDNRMTSRSEGGVTFTPVVEFFTADEQKIRTDVQSPSRTSRIAGETIEVYYDPADPTKVVTGTSASPVIGTVFGLVFIAFGVAWVAALTQV